MIPHQLSLYDLQWALRRCPKQVLELLKDNPKKLFIAGGYVRSIVANEDVADIDLFCGSKVEAKEFADHLVKNAAEKEVRNRLHETDNAFTVRGFRLPLQIIHRWTFAKPEDCLMSFDFTIAMGLIYNDGEKFVGICHPQFYQDLAAKRLIYTKPIRNEDAGGSMLRVLKFYQRGYRIPLASLGAVMARMTIKIRDNSEACRDEGEMARVLTGLLREVDPDIDPSHIAHLPDPEELAS